MPTASDLTRELAESLAKTESSVEAYGLALRKSGRWEPTKRGRGAPPVTDGHAGKLALAILFEGPTQLAAPAPGGESFFLTYANAVPVPHAGGPKVDAAIRKVLGLGEAAPDPRATVVRPAFLDYITALIGLHRRGEAERLIRIPDEPDEFYGEDAYVGPDVEISISGPFPIARLRLLFSHDFIDGLVAEGVREGDLVGMQELGFVHWAVFKTKRAIATKDYALAESFGNLVDLIREESARGVGFTRSIGGREIDALARALRGEVNLDA